MKDKSHMISKKQKKDLAKFNIHLIKTLNKVGTGRYKQIQHKRLHRYISFHCALLYCTPQILRFFNKLKVCGNCVLSKSIGTILPTIFAHFVFLSYFDNSHNISIFSTIIILVMVIFDMTIAKTS